MGERGLIRLVTQFDPPAARPAYATPSCGCGCCSSCCCCCVGTAVASLSFTAVNAYSVAQREERGGGAQVLAAILGGLALPVALVLAFSSESIGWGVATWLGLVLTAYVVASRRLTSALGRTGAVVLVAVVAGTGEFVIGAAALSTGFLVFEFLVGVIVAALSFRLARRW